MDKVFTPIAHSAWIKQVKIDLKGQSIESKDWIVEHDIRISSFSDINSLIELPNINIPNTKDHDNSWQIIESFESSEQNSLNADILNALNYGAQGIILPSVLLSDSSLLISALKEISLDYIHTGFCAKSLGCLNEVFATLSPKTIVLLKPYLEIAKFEWSGDINIENASLYLNNIAKLQLKKSPDIMISISCKEDQTPSCELSQILLQLNIWAEAAKSSKSNFESLYRNTSITIELEDRYFVNIAKIRALKILLKNWSSMFFGHIVGQPIIRAIVSELDSEDPNISYIPMTWKAMSAVISGVDQLQIIPLHNDIDSRRNTRNIHHLLSEEAHLAKVIEPTEGSYLIEQTTKKIANKSWELFYNNIETYAS